MRSLKMLAERSGLKLRYEMRKPKSLWKRATQHAAERTAGRADVKGVHKAAILASNPGAVAEGFRVHRAREKVDGRRAADEILVRLSLS